MPRALAMLPSASTTVCQVAADKGSIDSGGQLLITVMVGDSKSSKKLDWDVLDGYPFLRCCSRTRVFDKPIDRTGQETCSNHTTDDLNMTACSSGTFSSTAFFPARTNRSTLRAVPALLPSPDHQTEVRLLRSAFSRSLAAKN